MGGLIKFLIVMASVLVVVPSAFARRAPAHPPLKITMPNGWSYHPVKPLASEVGIVSPEYDGRIDAADSLNLDTCLYQIDIYSFKGKGRKSSTAVLKKYFERVMPPPGTQSVRLVERKNGFGIWPKSLYEVLQKPYGNSALTVVLLGIPKRGKVLVIKAVIQGPAKGNRCVEAVTSLYTRMFIKM